jgi:hypothetical protein
MTMQFKPPPVEGEVSDPAKQHTLRYDPGTGQVEQVVHRGDITAVRRELEAGVLTADNELRDITDKLRLRLARKLFSRAEIIDQATDRLIDLALDPATPSREAVAAIKEIYDRGVGKATSRSESTITGDFTDDRRIEIALAAACLTPPENRPYVPPADADEDQELLGEVGGVLPALPDPSHGGSIGTGSDPQVGADWDHLRPQLQDGEEAGIPPPGTQDHD